MSSALPAILFVQSQKGTLEWGEQEHQRYQMAPVAEETSYTRTRLLDKQ